MLSSPDNCKNARAQNCISPFELFGKNRKANKFQIQGGKLYDNP